VLLKEDYPMLLTGKLADIRTSEVPLTDTKLTLVTKSTLTHELCHSFALGDEYGETPDDDSDTNQTVPEPLVSSWKYTKYTSPPRNLDIYRNIQAKSDFERPKPGGGTELDAFRLKWRYHRIQKCTLVTAISSPGTELIATLKNPEVAFGVN